MEMIVSRVHRNVKNSRRQNSVRATSKVGSNRRLLWIFNDWLRVGPPQRVKIQQIPRDNGDEISSQIVQIRVFCRVCHCRQVKIHQEKKKRVRRLVSNSESIFQKFCQVKSLAKIQSNQSNPWAVPFVPCQVLLRLRHEINSDRINYESIIIVQV